MICWNKLITWLIIYTVSCSNNKNRDRYFACCDQYLLLNDILYMYTVHVSSVCLIPKNYHIHVHMYMYSVSENFLLKLFLKTDYTHVHVYSTAINVVCDYCHLLVAVHWIPCLCLSSEKIVTSFVSLLVHQLMLQGTSEMHLRPQHHIQWKGLGW